MANLSTKLPFNLLLTQWASTLNPVIANPILSGNYLTKISLINGANVINHGLSRQPQGWVITDINAAATIYRSQPFNSSTITLTSNAAAIADILVY